jgi:hypothetical protein
MALSADRSLDYKNVRGQTYNSGTVKTGSTVYKGSLCCTNAAGTIVVAANTTTTRFFGIARAGAVAGATVEVVNNVWSLVPIKTGTTVGYTGKKVYCYDDQTVTGSVATLGPVCGVLKQLVSATTGWVAFGDGELGAAS